MDIRWLEDFISLARTRNFSRSADDRGVTQSALSRRIQSLEAWVGADLVDRSSYPLVLTAAGKLFAATATEAVRLLNDTRSMLRVEETNDQVLRVSAPNRAGSPAFALPGGNAAPLPYLAYTATSYFGRVVQRLQARAGQPVCLCSCYESDMAELLKTMALSGHGLAWLPESSIARELAEGKLVRAGGDLWTMRLEIRLFRAIAHRKPMLDKLWDQLRQDSRAAS
jgi:DNA-binding transcriptional LysR family regulator